MFYSVISCAVSWNIAGGGKGNGGRGEQCRYQDRSCDGRTEFLSYSTQEKCSLLFCCQKCHSKQHIVNKPVMQLCCPWQQYAARFYIRRKLYAMSWEYPLKFMCGHALPLGHWELWRSRWHSAIIHFLCCPFRTKYRDVGSSSGVTSEGDTHGGCLYSHFSCLLHAFFLCWSCPPPRDVALSKKHRQRACHLRFRFFFHPQIKLLSEILSKVVLAKTFIFLLQFTWH